MNVAKGVDIPPEVIGWKPFKSVINDGGWRTSWKIVLEGKPDSYFFSNFKDGITGEVCDARTFRSGERCTLKFLTLGEGAKLIFGKSQVKREIDNGRNCYIYPDWSQPDTRVPLGMVLEYVEEQTPKGKDVLKIEIKYNEALIEDLKEFLPKAQKPNRPWEIQVNIGKYEDEDLTATLFADKVNKLNQTVLRYKINAKASNDRSVSVTLKKKELSERVERCSLTLSERDVARKTLSEVLNDVGAVNRDTKVKHLSLPFKPALYGDEWKNTSLSANKDPTFMVREAVASLLRRDDFKDLKELRLTSMEGLKPEAFQRNVNKMLKTRNIDRLVSVSPEGVITFKKYNHIHMTMPAFESKDRDITTSYDNEDKAVERSMLTLKWTDKWTKWFKDPTTDFVEFIEALAEHPEIRCVDFSLMSKDSVGHQKYLTEDAVKQLLKVNNVYFICRYMPNKKAGSSKDWKTWITQYNLSFVKHKDGKPAWFFWYGDQKNTTKEDKGGGWLQVCSKGRYVVAKTENRKKRLLWNGATLADILNASQETNKWLKRGLLAAFSGRMQNRKDCSSYKYGNLPTEKKKDKDNEDVNKNAEPLVPYEPIDIIDFTIGDPEGEFKFGNKKYTWSDVHESINGFCSSVFDVGDNTYDLLVKSELENKLKWNEENTEGKTTNFIKGLQLVEHLNFMEQWELIRENKNWKEDNKLSLISKLGLEKPSIRMLQYPVLLERMFQWENEVREAFVKQWNEAYKNDKNTKVKDTQPLLTEKDAKLQQKQISDRWDVMSLKDVAALAKLLKDNFAKFAAKIKGFFDSVDFRGVVFEFPKKTNFAEEVEAYNKDKDSKNKLAWLPQCVDRRKTFASSGYQC